MSNEPDAPHQVGAVTGSIWSKSRTWILIAVGVALVVVVAVFLASAISSNNRRSDISECIQQHRDVGDTRQDIFIRYECTNRVDNGYRDDDPHLKK